MESVLTIVRENSLRLDILSNIDLKCGTGNISSSINKIINIMSILRGFDNIENIDVLCDFLIELRSSLNLNAECELVISKKISLLEELLKDFIKKARQFNKINIVFDNEDVEKEFAYLFDYNHITKNGGIISLLIFRGNAYKYDIGKFDLALDIEDFICNLVDETYNSPFYRHIICSRKYKKMVEGKIDSRIFSTGSSYSVYGLNRDYMKNDIFDISIMGQDLYYTKKSIEKALEYNKIIDTCLISIAYYSFYYDMSKSKNEFNRKLMDDVFAPIFNDSHNSKINKKEYSFKANLTKMSLDEKYLFDIENLSTCIVKKIQDGVLSERYVDFFNSYITREGYNDIYRGKPEFRDMLEEDKYLDMKSLVESHKKLYNYKKTNDEYRKIMVDILDICNSNGIKPIFVVYPMPVLYKTLMGDYYKNDFFEYIDILKESYSFNILNMYEMDFDDSCFVDLQHLGTEGSIKATRVICEYLKDIIELKGEDVF